MLAGESAQHELKMLDFSEAINRKDPVRFVAWARVKGEIMLFPNKESMLNRAYFPRCISGLMMNDNNKDLIKYDRKKLIITGIVVEFMDLKLDSTLSFFPRRLIGNTIIPDFCQGSKVIIIEKIGE